MRKNIMITGGNGYVGRELVGLLAEHHNVCVVDSLRYGQLRLDPKVLSKIRLEKTDIRDADAVEGIVTAFCPDVIVHLAAIHYIPECEQKPELAVQTNVDGTINLLRAAPPRSHFVFASSGAVYRPDEQPHDEVISQLEPSDVYGFTKLHGEHYVGYFARQRDFSAVVVRLFNVVGPGETNPHLLPELVAQLKAGRKRIKLGNIWPKRDYIHVRDAARGFCSVALDADGRRGETVTVNLGTSKAHSVAEIVTKLRHASHIDFAVEQDESRLRKVDRPYLAADIRWISRRFGWTPIHSIDDAITDIWRNPELAVGLMEKYQ